MSASTEQRKLAAIMFTDMVGYSALSQRDDKLALELLEEHRQILRKIFPEFSGTEVKTIGDAFLVEFQSALEAAQCAIEIQRALAKRNADAPPDRRIEVKIGIHIGDVVHRGGDVYGDGVNIASRIEPLAGAGGICVSMDVERQIRNAVETRFEKLAPTELKNISVAMDLFRIVLPWERQPAPAGAPPITSAARSNKRTWIAAAPVLLFIIGIGWWWTTLSHKNAALRQVEGGRNAGEGAAATPSSENGLARPSTSNAGVPAAPDKSIAVLPFDNLSDDKANAYFAEGIQDEILTRLSKIAALKVISRSSTRKYQSSPDNLRDVGRELGVANILEGSVQKIANTVKVNVQLIRATTDEHLWAESYNRKLDDVFGVEGEVAAAIADQLNAKLSGAEQKAVSDKPTENVAAYDAYLRGLAIEHNRFSFSAYKDAEKAYAQATQLDPKFALAWSRVAVIRSFLYFNGVDPARYTGASVKEAADRAMELRPDLGEAWVAQGAYKYRVLRDFPAALAAYQEGGRRIPNNALVFEYLAYVERRMGHWKDAEEHYRKAAELDPLNLQLFVSMGSEFFNLLRRFDEALAMLQRALQISPNDEDTLANIAAIYQTTGRLGEARTELDKIPANATEPLVSVSRATQLLCERRFDDAVTFLTGVVSSTKPGEALNTTSIGFVVQLGVAQELAGHKDDARATFARAVQAIKPTPETTVPVGSLGLPGVLALAYAGLGDKEKALAQAKEAVADYATDAVAKPTAEVTLAQIQARFGDTESAIAALPHLLTEPAGLNPADLRNDPLWDPIRKDPRFQKYSTEGVPAATAQQ